MVQLCPDASIELSKSGTESRKSLPQGELYHSMILRIYNTIRITTPSLLTTICLSSAVKVLNDASRPRRLVLSLLLFGEMPRHPLISHFSDKSIVCHVTLLTARKEYEMEIARRKIKICLLYATPRAHRFRFAPDRAVYVFRKKEKRWNGHSIRSSLEVTVLVDLGRC